MGQQTFQVTIGGSIGSVAFNSTVSLSGDLTENAITSVPVAWAGTLTTRTSATAGTLTMTSASHTIVTGALLDIYWAGGCCYQATVGTVAGTSVPFTGAQGTALPAATTAINAITPVKKIFNFTVANLQALACQNNYNSQFTIVDTDGTTVRFNNNLVPATSGVVSSYFWYTGLVVNPVAGTTVGFIYMSHADPAAAHVMSAAYLSN